MKKLYYACLLMLVGILVVATPVLAAIYYANLQVQESDGNSYNRLPIMVSLDNEYLADNNYILATGLDTRVITGSSVPLPWLVVDDRLLFVSTINAHNTYNFKYTTGNIPPDPADMPIIVGYDGYITIPSDTSDDMQLGDDFEIEFDGYVDTSYPPPPPSYQGAGAVAIAASGNVTPALPAGWLPDDIWFCLIASLDNVNSTLPAGWTAVDAGTNNGAGLRTTLYWRRAVTGAAAPLVTHAAGAGISAVVVGYHGVTTAPSPFNVNQSVYVKTLASIVNNFGGGMATTVDNCMIVLVSGVGGTTLSDTYTGAPTPTERVDGPNTASRPSLVVADFVLAAPGVTGARTSTITSFLNNGYQISLIPLDKSLVYKEGAFRVYVSDEEEITAEMFGAMAWISPTGHDDPGDQWSNETNAYDESEDSLAGSSSTTEYLELTVDSIDYCSGIRVLAADFQSPTYFNPTVEVDLFYGSNWHNVLNESITKQVWHEEYFDTVMGVTSARIRITSAKPHRLYEFDFYGANSEDFPIVPRTGISSGIHTIKAYADGTDLGIIVDEGEVGEISNTVLLDSAEVPDNANDIIINQNNVMPYFDYLKWTVGVDLIAWYQPISMIVGTTLDDREGTDAGETGTAEEDATIVWGENPAGVDVDIGSLTAYSQPAPSGTITEPGQDIVEETGQPGWTDETGTLTTNPFYPAVLMASEQTGFDVTQIWLMIATFFVIGGMLAVFGFVPHQLITVCVGGGITGFFISMGIYPFWTIFIFLVMGVAVVLWERAPTV